MVPVKGIAGTVDEVDGELGHHVQDNGSDQLEEAGTLGARKKGGFYARSI